jgi:outer membrane protein OmpA-like peptidoglycan-associated protein
MKIVHAVWILLLMLFMGNGVRLSAQSPAAFEQKAKEAAEKKDYNAALAYYNALIQDDSARVDLYFKAAELAREAKIYRYAETYFEKWHARHKNDADADAYYKLGLVKKALGKYKEATANFRKAGPSHIKARNEIETCQWAEEIVGNPNKIDIYNLGPKVNTPFTDFGGIMYQNRFYYTSVKTNGASLENLESADMATRIFSTDTMQKGEPIALNPTDNKEHAAHYAVNSDGSRLYYNLCEYKDKVFTCALYFREKETGGGWKSPVRLPESINMPGYTTTQPHAVKEGGKEILYFSSNRPGGKGGMDIWYVTVGDNTFSPPVNMKEVNTAGNEITPFYYVDGGVLFFSSDGHRGLGGFDVFKYPKDTLGEWTSVQNMGYPLNSSYDDMYYTFNSADGKSYFTSNRTGGTCLRNDGDCVCNDIYAYDAKIDLMLYTRLRDGSNLDGCTLTLIDKATGAMREIPFNGKGWQFGQMLEFAKSYRVVATKSNFSADTIDFTTKEYYETTTLQKELRLRPRLSMRAYVLDEVSRQPLNGATIAFGEVGDKPLEMKTLQGHEFTYDILDFNKRYFFRGSKATYGKDSTSFSTGSMAAAKFEYVDTIYLSPFTGLPVVLYFDNDRPDKSSKTTFTMLSYGESFATYMSKQGEFAQNAAKLKQDGSDDIQRFFYDSIQAGYIKLMDFSNLLQNYLNNGNSLEVVMQGFASPLAATDYNESLTSRRISSVLNHFYTFNNGALQDYMQKGRLRVRIEPLGETKARTGVSDDPKQRAMSVYAVDASRERKVVILEINRLNIIQSNEVYAGFDLLKPYLSAFARQYNNTAPISNISDATVAAAEMATDQRFVARSGHVEGARAKTLTGRSNHSTASNFAGTPAAVGYTGYELKVKNPETGQDIPNATVEVYDFKTGRRLGKATQVNGAYRYKTTRGQEYEFRIKAKGYGETKFIYRGSEGAVADVTYMTKAFVDGGGSGTIPIGISTGQRVDTQKATKTAVTIARGGSSESGVRSGYELMVADLNTSKRIEDASVTVKDAATGKSLGTATRTANGYRFKTEAGRRYEFKIAAKGYHTATRSYTTTDGAGVNEIEYLTPIAAHKVEMAAASKAKWSYYLTVTDLNTASVIENSTVTVYDVASSRKLGLATRSGKGWMYKMEAGKSYEFRISAKGYESSTLNYVAQGEGSDVEQTVQLAAAANGATHSASTTSTTGAKGFELIVVDALTGDEIIGADVDAYIGGAKSGKLRFAGNSYRYNTEVGKMYDFRVSSAGYSAETLSYTGVEGAGARETVRLTPFATMPLSLYFDNDHPNPNSTTDATELNYETTYRSFSSRKGEFKRMYQKASGATDGAMMETFFADEVKGNFDRLTGYSQIVRRYLTKGYSMEIVLQGCTSALANNDYNRHLANRRVVSVANYFKSTFGNYIRSGNLKVTVEEPVLSQSASESNNADPKTIYGLEASRDRRVTIKEIKLLKQ